MNILEKSLNIFIVIFIAEISFSKVNAGEFSNQSKKITGYGQIKALSQIENNNEINLREVLKSYPKECEIFLRESKLSWGEHNITTCFYKLDIDDKSQKILPELVNRLLTHQPAASKKNLDKVLKLFANDSFKSDYTEVIKKLITAGASTKNIHLQLIQRNGDNVCESIFLVVKASEKIYKDKKLLKKYDKDEDLHFLADTGMGYSLCKDALLLLIKYNPKLINRIANDGLVPVHHYFSDSKHPQWDVKIAKLLMTKENINVTNHYKVTPLYVLLRDNKSPHDLETIRYALKLGVNLDIRSYEGITVRDLILKRPDLMAALKGVIKPK